MAEVKQNGIVVNPSSGSGDTTLQVKAEVVNRGNRLAQVATFEVEGTGVAEKKQFVANHLPAAEFIRFDNTNQDSTNLIINLPVIFLIPAKNRAWFSRK